MINDLLKFKLDLTHFQEVVVKQELENVIKRITIRLYDSITDGTPGTPRDTGWHRANWGVHVGVSQPPQNVSGTYPEEKRGLYQPMPKTAYFDVHAIVAMRNLGPTPFIWLYNNAPGIEALENGHSKQAPTGMVIHALHDIQEFIDEL